MFNKQSTGGQARQAGSARTPLENRVNACRSTMILVVVFSLVNCMLMLTGSDTYFLFSAMIPYFLVTAGMLWTGRLPEVGVPKEPWPDSMLYILAAVAFVLIAVYVVCFILTKKFPLPSVLAGTVCFALDTIVMIFLSGISSDMLLNYAFHGIVLVSMVSGVIAAIQLKKLPPETPEVAPAQDGYIDPAFTAQSTDSTESTDSTDKPADGE